MQDYKPKEIESKWQSYWDKNKTFDVSDDATKEKFYSLIEFPYPSGAGLHVGHARPFTAMDIVSRKKRMEGYNVLYPIGFDAFGLPTENYAIKTGRPPAEVTAENIATFTRQLRALGYSFDWSRVVDTTDPKYFRWTQWIFLQFYKHGLAYKKNQPINWCPKDKIGLANEEVVNGCCERCGTPVEKRDKEQWMLAITKYADKLLEGLKEVDYIPQARLQQENWIGRSEGAEIQFKIKDLRLNNGESVVTVFTTRPDTIFGATFLAISAELAKSWLDAGWQTSEGVQKYVERTLSEEKVLDREEKEKTGVDSGIKAINPVTNEEIPAWITNYVMGGVGTGAIMAVPAHDSRDFDFAKKYHLPVKQVVAPFIELGGDNTPKIDKETTRKHVVTAIIKNTDTDAYLLLEGKDGQCVLVGCGIEKGEDPESAVKREIAEETGYTSHTVIQMILPSLYGHGYKPWKDVNCYDHDTVFYVEVSGEPQQELSDEDKNNHEIVWVDVHDVGKKINREHHLFMWNWHIGKKNCYEEDGIAVHSDFLNDLLTPAAKEKMIEWLEEKKIGKRQVNYKLRDWVFSRQRYWGEPIPLVFCQSCSLRVKAKGSANEGEKLNPGWVPLDESDLPLELPTVERYEPTDTGESPLSAITDWVKTKCPRCGGDARRETDTMPNWAGSSWYFLRYTDPHNAKAFAAMKHLKYWMNVDWYNGGMEHTVLHLLYSRFWNQFLYDIGKVPTREPYKKRTSHGLILGPDGEKMSKSRGNVVNPDEMIEKFGTDAFRAYIAFMGPFDQPVKWDTNGLVGVQRFLEKIWYLFVKVSAEQRETSESINKLIHKTIKKVSVDIDAMRFNTAVAKLMEMVNELGKEKTIARESYEAIVKLLAPFAPHMAEELWQLLGNKESITYTPWPVYNSELAKDASFTIAVQINGKVRHTLEVDADTDEESVKKLALVSEKVQKWLDGKEPKKVIYVKGKLVSVVV